MNKSIQAVPGVYDITPHDSQELWRSSYLWQFVESLMRKTAAEYGFQEIRTPMFERTELFQRSSGESSDIVAKEMYTFLDKGSRPLSLRPEGTASALRAFIENRLDQRGSSHKLYYICPMFRYDRAQAGRYRQHHQFGVEAIGIGSPEQDAELIDLLHTIYCRLGLENLQVYINSIGDQESRFHFKKALQDYLRGHFDKLSEDSKNRFETNPLRILDSKDATDQAIVTKAPSILDYLNSESQDHFNALQALLKRLKIPFQINPHLVRGLDYYNRTVFEVTTGALGAQNSIAGGGRYDGLLKALGGPDLPSSGFGCGIERLLQTLLKQNVSLPSPRCPQLYFIPLGDEARLACFGIVHDLRQQGFQVDIDLSGRKIGKAMQQADQIGTKFVVVYGDNEIRSQQLEIKEMHSGEKYPVALSELSVFLKG